MHQCYKSCIYYHIIQDRTKKPSTKLTCDIKDGQEIKNIPNEEIQNCEHFKTYNEVKENNRKVFQIDYWQNTIIIVKLNKERDKVYGGNKRVEMY